MPFIAPVVLGAVTAAPKLYAAYQQNRKAANLKLQDSTPAAFREKAALDRQAAASGVMPGQVAAQTRLAGIQAGALQSARMGAASSGDFLAAAGGADARRQSGEQQLGTQAAQYGIRAQDRVGADLTQQAAYQQRDLDNYNKTEAALTQSSAQNLDNAVEGAAGYAAYGINAKASTLGVQQRQEQDAEMGSELLTPRPIGVDMSKVGTVGGRVPAAPGADLYPQTGGTYQPGQVQGLRRPRYAVGLGGYSGRRIGL